MNRLYIDVHTHIIFALSYTEMGVLTMVQGFSLRKRFSWGATLYISLGGEPIPIYLYAVYTKKEIFMATNVREEMRGQGGTEQESSFETLVPILLTTMMGRQQEKEGSFETLVPILLTTMMGRQQEKEGIHPLLLAALMARRQEREEGMGISPLLLAALMARRGEREEQGEGMGIHPLLLAALMARRGEREEQGEGISPLLLAALMARRGEREKAAV